MIVYLYKKFEISYNISKKSTGNFVARGFAKCLDSPTNEPATPFNTEFPTKEGAELEIKKMIEEYVEFEYSQINF